MSAVSSLPYKVIKYVTKFNQPDAEGKLVEIIRSNYKLFENMKHSTQALAELDITDFKHLDNRIYGGKPCLDVDLIEVQPDAQGKGISKELLRLAVQHSWENGYKGRLSLNASNALGSPAAVIHTKNGLRLVRRRRAQKLKRVIYKNQRLKFKSFEGEMWLPYRKIKQYLNMVPLSWVEKTVPLERPPQKTPSCQSIEHKILDLVI